MNLNFFTRLTLPTPQFWIRVQLVCLGLLVIVGKLAMMHLFPDSLYFTLFGALSGIALIAQLAVKDQAIIADAIKDPSTLLQHLPEILDQLTQIKTVVTAKPEQVVLNYSDALNAAQKIVGPIAPVPAPDSAPAAPSMTTIVGNLAASDPETKTDVSAALKLIMGDQPAPPFANP